MKKAKTIKDVEKEYGMSITSLVEKYDNEGYSKSEMTQIFGLNNQSAIDNALRRARTKVIHNLRTFRGSGGREKTITAFKEDTGKDLYDFINDLYKVQKDSMQDIANKLNSNTAYISALIKHLGITRDISEAHRLSIDSGKKDYSSMVQKSNETLMRKRYSKEKKKKAPDEYFGDNLKFHLERLITESGFNVDVVIGYNNWGILKNREIDIPIIVHDIDTDRFIKISIEYQGHYHNDKEEDKLKEKDVTDRGWIHIVVEHRNHKQVQYAREYAEYVFSIIKKELF